MVWFSINNDLPTFIMDDLEAAKAGFSIWSPDSSIYDWCPEDREFPYEKVGSFFIMEPSVAGYPEVIYSLRIDEDDERGLIRKINSPCFSIEPLRIDEKFVGLGDYNDFSIMAGYALERFPMIAHDIGDVPNIDMNRFQNAISNKFYMLMRKAVIERSVISLDKRGFSSEQIKKILGLIEPLKKND